MELPDLIVRPLLTEKGTLLREQHNKVCFIVHPSANRKTVKRAVEEVLKVKVEKVNILNVLGKRKQTGRFSGKRPDWKKAIVTLQPGEKLEQLEG